MPRINMKNLKIEFKLNESLKNDWNPNGQMVCDEETFVKNNPLTGKSIFKELDTNKDGYISESEYQIALGCAGKNGILTDKKRQNACMSQLLFFARRGIDKWFKIDKNRDGYESNVESRAWTEYNRNGKTLNGMKSNSELTGEYGMEEIPRYSMDIEDWIDGEIEDLKQIAKNQYGVELSQKQIIELKKEQIKQLNTWLFKTGDNNDSSFYEQLNLDAYTRLGSTVDGEACCGGDICEIPDFRLNDLEDNGFYTASDMRARLAWAENSYKVDENGNTVLDDSGNRIPAKIMTQEQVQKYKEIVESVTGKPWDSDDWTINIEQFFGELMNKVNGTYGDAERLQGKTRADVPENRQALLRYLEEKGWLYEQFK